MPFRPFTSKKQSGWYFSNKKAGTVPKDFFKKRYMKMSAEDKYRKETPLPYSPITHLRVGSAGIGPWGGR